MADIFLPLTGLRPIIVGFYFVLAVIFIGLGITVYRRGQKSDQRSYILKFFFYVGGSLVVNIIYAFIADITVQWIGNNTVILLTTMGVVNLMLFTLSIYYSKEQLTWNKSLIIEILVLIASIVYYIIGYFNGTQIMLDYSPRWNPPMLIYGMIVTQSLMVTTLIYGYQISNNMKIQVIKRRYQLFLIGLVFAEILLISTFLGNGGLIEKNIFTILALSIIPVVPLCICRRWAAIATRIIHVFLIPISFLKAITQR